jgi:hypothetical protein
MSLARPLLSSSLARPPPQFHMSLASGLQPGGDINPRPHYSYKFNRTV